MAASHSLNPFAIQSLCNSQLQASWSNEVKVLASRALVSHRQVRRARSLEFNRTAKWKARAVTRKDNGEESDVDDNILPYCDINKKSNKTIGEKEQEFLLALQAFYLGSEPLMTNEEFDILKEDLTWEGSKVIVLSKEEQKFMEASLAYQAGKPFLSDKEYDDLKITLKQQGSEVAIEGPRCSLRSRKVYSDSQVDYLRMTLLNVPAALIALLLVFFVDDLTGFEITYLLELPEPYSFLFTWFVVLPATYLVAQSITGAFVKDFLILQGPCPNCGTRNVSFFGTILTVSSGLNVNTVKCESCGSTLSYDMQTRRITLESLPPLKTPKPKPPPRKPAATKA